MKKIVKKLLTAACAAVGVTGMAFGLGACNKQDVEAYKPNYEFDKPSAVTDDDIMLDGVLNEGRYRNQRWLTVHKEHGGEKATLKMTSWFGDNGIYFGFDIEETCRIYVNHARASFMNSGIEMYIAPQGTLSIDTDNSYEVDLEADGTLTFKRRVNGGWESVHSYNSVMARLATKSKGAAVNEEGCYGYTHELFIPYEYLEYLGFVNKGEKPKEVYINPVIISSYSYDGTKLNSDRHWFNTVADQLDGDGWGNPSQNYHFDAHGLVSHDINVNATNGGSVRESRGYDYVADGNTTTLEVKANAGYKLTSFEINGKDRRGDIIDKYVTLPLVTSDINVNAKFEKVSSKKATLSGKISYDGMHSAFMDDIEVVAFDGSNYFGTTLDRSTGEYTAELPLGQYELRVISAVDNYTAVTAQVTVAGDTRCNLEVGENMYGSTRSVEVPDAILSGGSKTLFTGKIDNERFVFKHYLGLSAGSGSIADTGVFVEEYFMDMDNDSYFRFQLMNWYGRYIVKCLYIDDGKEKDISVQLGGRTLDTLLANNGLYFALVRNNERISLYALCDNGTWATLIRNADVSAVFANTKVTGIRVSGNEGVSASYAAEFGDAVFIQGAQSVSDIPNTAVALDADENATVTGLENSYKIGDKAEFVVTPQDGYVYKVFINGKAVTSADNSYSFTVGGRADISIVTQKNNAQTISVDISGYKFGKIVDLDGVTIEMIGVKDYTATVRKGVLTVENMIPGEYEVYADGYVTHICNFGTDRNIELVYRMFGSAPDWDLNGQNTEDPAVSTNGGATSIKSYAQYRNFYMETLLKYDQRLAASADNSGSDEYTQRKGYTLIFDNGRKIQPSLNMYSVQFAPLDSDSVGGWDSVYTLTDEQIEMYRTVGIKMGVMRFDNAVSVFIEGEQVAQYDLGNSFKAAKATVGYHLYIGAPRGTTTFAYAFNEITTRNISLSPESTFVGGNVTLDGEFEAGSDVKLKITPDKDGERLFSIIVNGKERINDYAFGYVTLKNCNDLMLKVKASFGAPTLDVTPVNGTWDLSLLEENTVVTGNTDNATLLFGEGCDDFMIKGVFKTPTVSNNINRQEFVICYPASKQFISFGLVYTANDNNAWLQAIDSFDAVDGYSTPFAWWSWLERDLTADEISAYCGDGIQYMLVRKGADYYFFLDGKFVKKRTVNSGYIANPTGKADVYFKHWADSATRVEIPMAFDRQADKYIEASNVSIAAATNGTVTADKSSYEPLNNETITLTVAANTGYLLSSLTVNDTEVGHAVVGGKYILTGIAGGTYVKAAFIPKAEAQADDITVTAVDHKGAAIAVPAGAEFTLTNSANGLVYTAVKQSDGSYAWQENGVDTTTVATLEYVLTSDNFKTAKVSVGSDGAAFALDFKPFAVTAKAITDNTTKIELRRPVGDDEVLAFERWISHWDSNADTEDRQRLINGGRYWLQTLQTAYPGNTAIGAFDSHKGWAVGGLGGEQAKYDGWAPVIKSIDNTVKITNKVTRIRVYVGGWWNSRTATFTLKLGDEVYSEIALEMTETLNHHAIIEFAVDARHLADGTKLGLTLSIDSSGSDGIAVAGIQVLGAI